MLAQMLQEEGLEVDYNPPTEGRSGVADSAVEVVFYVLDKSVDATVGAGGALLAPKVTAAIKRFKERVPRAEVGIIDEGQSGAKSPDA